MLFGGAAAARHDSTGGESALWSGGLCRKTSFGFVTTPDRRGRPSGGGPPFFVKEINMTNIQSEFTTKFETALTEAFPGVVRGFKHAG